MCPKLNRNQKVGCQNAIVLSAHTNQIYEKNIVIRNDVQFGMPMPGSYIKHY